MAFVPMFGIHVVVGLRANVFCRFWEPLRAGEVLPKFSMESNHLPFLCRTRTVGRHSATPIVFVGVAVLPAPRRLATAATRHRPTSLTSPTP